MSATNKARGGQASELTKLKLLSPDKQEVIWSWRDELENDKPLTNAQIRNRIATRYGIRLSRDGQLSDFWSFYQRRADLQETNSTLEDFDEFTRQQHPDWTPEQVRQKSIDFFLYLTVAKKNPDKFATIMSIDQNERFGKTKAAQKDRQLDQQDRKIKLLEQKAAAFDQAKGVLEDKQISEEERKLKMRELFGLS